jgi:4-amino-4-deoxy-L-arabinose transferase-like glycosyltransferase
MHLNMPTRGRTVLVYLLLLCAAQLLQGVFYFGSVPRFHGDEAWDASLGDELAATGVLRHPFIQNFGGMEVYFIQPRILLPIVCAGVCKIAGYSIFISRLPSLLFGVLAVIALYHIAERFFGDKQSFFICLAAIINPWFWVTSRCCRPEIYYTALALLFLWLVISYFRRDRALIAFLAGITAALASLTHPNGLLIVIAISIAWIVWKGKPHLPKFILWALAGFILAILPYAIYTFWASSQPNVSFFKQMHGGSIYGSILVREIMRWKSFLRLPFGIPVALVMFVSWLAAWWKSTNEDKLAATIVTIYPLSLLFLSVDAIAVYIVVIVPFFSILIVRFISRLYEFHILNRSDWMRYIVKNTVILIYIISSLTPIIFMLYFQRSANFNKVVDEVAKVVGPRARVYGDPVFWVGRDRYIYGPYLIAYDAVTFQDALQWAYLQSFEYVVRTAWGNSGPPRGLGKVPDKMPGFRQWLVGDTLCRKFGSRIYKFYNADYGPVEIYKINWPPNPESWGLRKQGAK